MSKLSFLLLTFSVLFNLNHFASAQEQSNADVYDSTTKNLQGGKALEMPKPKFPSTAKALGISGQVNVVVVVDEAGVVISAKGKTGHPFLVPSAVEAAKLAKFTPTTLNGEKVRMKGTIVYNFVRNPNWEKIGFSLGAIERQIPAFGADSIESDFISKQLNRPLA